MPDGLILGNVAKNKEGSARALAAPVDEGIAGNYAILAGMAFTNAPFTIITGGAVGWGLTSVALVQAMDDMKAAFKDTSSRAPDSFVNASGPMTAR